MRLRRLFAVGASAALGAFPNATWCMPPKREGVDDQGRLKYHADHLQIFGQGFHHDVYWKAKILQMWGNTQQFYEDREKKKKMPAVHDFFHAITGFGHQRVSEYTKEMNENNGLLLPPDQRGRQLYMLENDYPDFEAWVDNQALQAMSSYLTVQNLLPKFTEEFGVVISYHLLRKALVRLDFKYEKRERAYVSNKWKPDVLQLLFAHVSLVRSKVAFNRAVTEPGLGGRWYFINPTVFEDEAYILSGEMRAMSWIRQRNKYRNIMKGGNKRHCMVASIFSHNPGGVKGLLRHWNMGWKVEKPGRPYFGKMDGPLCRKYFGEVFEVLGQTDVTCTVFLDNWSVHKKFEDEFGKTSKQQSEWMWKFCEKEMDYNSTFFKEWRRLYVNLGGAPSCEAILEFVKKHKVPIRQLEMLAYSYNAQVKYLAPYWSPTNPVEFVWARLKQIIKDLPQDLSIDERVDRAWAQIDHEFISQCIDRSIRFSLSWYARFRGAGMIRAVGADGVADVRGAEFGPTFQFGPLDRDSDDGADSDSSSEADDPEPDFKRFRH